MMMVVVLVLLYKKGSTVSSDRRGWYSYVLLVGLCCFSFFCHFSFSSSCLKGLSHPLLLCKPCQKRENHMISLCYDGWHAEKCHQFTKIGEPCQISQARGSSYTWQKAKVSYHKDQLADVRTKALTSWNLTKENLGVQPHIIHNSSSPLGKWSGMSGNTSQYRSQRTVSSSLHHHS